MKASKDNIEAITKEEEVGQVINQACHCMDEDKDWKKKYQELFPDVKTVTTSKKVRDVTKMALMMVDGEAGATEHTIQLSDFTLPLMDKVRFLLKCIKFEELKKMKPDIRKKVEAGEVFGIQENQNDFNYSRLSLDNGRLLLHCLQNQPPPHVAITLPMSEIIKTLNPKSTITFLDMAWEGLTRGRVYIRVNEDTTEARQFVGLCTGQPGSSFLNTRLNRVVGKGEPKECVFGGNYNFNDNRIWDSNGGVGRVSFISNSEKSGQFCISTNRGYWYLGAVIGRVESGLEVVKAAVQLNDITQVTVVDCGVVVPL
ncbi:hypothetical protein Pcinc_007255 [Petrolisthes cinctipes]|uniref:Uncharacterized protein n=1 Tax=Petrolisthes cinctipes TaxID=88211 RepID=A0AAE1G8U3_PETCI|nr:hypothetical protein Pcinc_007255 [Petrolisthes cinctipes]